ncbi:hypothetical protein NQ314_006511 [Rhamnusium bicolor]|uniref:Uncharacterized protein n=1 Tax=Rhamnusium bicolor TaxID=1586634 RepID=A0AAV8Z340_9CUCU|nr:hypothetical protein NQ314_006511 [Rhamnusium bicolor]
MYRLYADYCKSKNLTVRNEFVYRKIFVEEFNLAFYKPHLDTCGKCDKYMVKLKYADSEAIRTQIQKERDSHLDLAESSYAQKRIDKESSRNNGKTITASFDLQKCLPTPFLSSGVSFYKRQLWTYNLTIHQTGRESPLAPLCYLWNETIAARGVDEVRSKSSWKSFFYKERFDQEDFKVIDFNKKTRHTVFVDNIPPTNNEPLPVSTEKLKDLKSLMCFIDKGSRQYYAEYIKKILSNEDVIDYLPDEVESDSE